MSQQQPLVFKIANEDWEFEQIHHLNYKTFVEEIPQHQPSQSQRLVDKFHAENTYLTCFNGRKLVGMLAVRGNRPFSLDQKLENLDRYLPSGRKICEIRLLALEKKYRGTRGGQVLQGILALLWQHGIEQGYDLAIISGTTRQEKLYRHLGFIPFGPLVGSGEAMFQPMHITLETFEAAAREFLRSSPTRAFQPTTANFLPGPVAIHRLVKRAFEQTPESHRADAFVADFQSTKELLRSLTHARHVEILVGSGTLANDTVAAQLSLEPGPGLILSNGEFGGRLMDHARRWRLEFKALEFPWGEPFDLEAVKRGMRQAPTPRWLWCTHCETSTGVLNDLEALKTICAEQNVKLCLDVISTIGTLPLDLTGVYFASGSSGKGLKAYPGLGIVFYQHEIQPAPCLPRYFDLGYYACNQGVPFTHSSNLVYALHASLKRMNWEKYFAEVAEISRGLRAKLRELGFNLIEIEGQMSPVVITIILPEDLNSVKIGGQLQEAGYLLSYNSEYLRQRNWIQICLMGEIYRDKIVSLVNAFNRICFKQYKQSTPAAAEITKL